MTLEELCRAFSVPVRSVVRRNPWRKGGPPNVPGEYMVFVGNGRILDCTYCRQLGVVISCGDGWRYDDRIHSWRRA